MKGIILAAGKGTRLYPMTYPVCKPLLPVYDKPLVYYPLSALQQAMIREVLIIVPPGNRAQFKNLFGNGEQLGMHISYEEQPVQRGIADAFLVGERFIGGDSVCLVLGDNIYIGNVRSYVSRATDLTTGAIVFGYRVEHPEAFGVIEFDGSGKAISIEEKPVKPRSNYIVPGLYFYDDRAISIAKGVKPSARGELEITSVNTAYLDAGRLQVIKLRSDFIWLDAGTEDSLLEASQTVQRVQRDTGKLVACIEENAWRNGWIDDGQLLSLAGKMSGTKYGKYLESCVLEGKRGSWREDI